MKKFLSILLVSVMMLSFISLFGANNNVLSFNVQAVTESEDGEKVEYFTEGYYVYYIDENGRAIIGKCSTEISGDIIIPETLGGYPVAGVQYCAFALCANITSVRFHKGITEIYDPFGNQSTCFSNCKNMKSVMVDEENPNYSTDEYGVLYNKDKTTLIYCPPLIEITEYVVPDTVTSIERFTDCVNIEKIVLPATLSDLGCFAGCQKLKNINIPSSVETIGDYAFKNCTALGQIDIPSTVYSISPQAFSGCASIDINIDSENQFLAEDNGVIYNKEMTEMILYSASKKDEEYVVPEGVESLGSFSGCPYLKKVTLPENLTMISDELFENCSALTEVRIPETVTCIGDRAFKGCGNLASIKIPDGITVIEEAAFAFCKSLKSIQIPDGVKWWYSSPSDYYYGTFEGCESLETVILPNDISEISYCMFADCSSLKTITIPLSVKQIGAYAFSGCTSLENIEIPDGITQIGSGAFAECKALAAVNIPDSVTQMYSTSLFISENLDLANKISPFYNCTNLKTIKLSDNLTEIRDEMFEGCTSLENVNIPENTTRIGEMAFKDTSVKSINIPKHVSDIGLCAFAFCGNLQSITVDENNQYYSSDRNGVLYNKDRTILIQYPFDKNDTETFVIPAGVTQMHEYALATGGHLKNVHVPKSLTLVISANGLNDGVWGSTVNDVYYEGTEDEYRIIENIEKSYLANATVHPNSYDKIVDDEPSEDDTPEMPTVENPVVLDWEEGCFGETEVTEVYECIENNFEKGGVYISENDELYNQFALYRIKILGENGEIVQPQDGYEVTVRILLPQEYKDIKNFYVVHWFNEGGREKIYDVKNDNGCLVFKTKSFSEFAICADLDFGFEDDSAKLNYKSEKNFSATTDSKTKVIYSSSDESVAAVDSNGNVKAVGIGSATITATIDGTEISDSINITVSYAWWQWIIRILLLGFLWY